MVRRKDRSNSFRIFHDDQLISKCLSQEERIERNSEGTIYVKEYAKLYEEEESYHTPGKTSTKCLMMFYKNNSIDFLLDEDLAVDLKDYKMLPNQNSDKITVKVDT